MIEIIQTVEILRCELVVSELIVAKLIVWGERVTASVCEIVTSNPSCIAGHCVIVTEIMGRLMTAAAYCVTSKSVCVTRKTVSAQGMATQPMPHMGQATMAAATATTTMGVATATTAMAAATATTAMAAATATTAMAASAATATATGQF